MKKKTQKLSTFRRESLKILKNKTIKYLLLRWYHFIFHISLKYWLKLFCSIFLNHDSYTSCMFTLSFNNSEDSEAAMQILVFLVKSVLEICSKFTGEDLCRSVVSIKLQSNFIEITFWYGCSPVNLLHIHRTLFTKNTCRLRFAQALHSLDADETFLKIFY